MKIIDGCKYKICVSVEGRLFKSVHYKVMDNANQSNLQIRSMKEAEFDQLFRPEANLHIMRIRVDGIDVKNEKVHFTPITPGGLPLPGEHCWPLKECEMLFQPF